jgi:hypothetical protein
LSTDSLAGCLRPPPLPLTAARCELDIFIGSFSSNDSLGRPHLHSPSQVACRVFLIKKTLFLQIACRLRDVGWDPSHTQGTPCAAPSVRRASHLPIRQRCSSRCPTSGQLEEVMWGCQRVCVTITVHVPTPCRCSLLAASDPLSRSLTGSVVGCFICQRHVARRLWGEEPDVWLLNLRL